MSVGSQRSPVQCPSPLSELALSISDEAETRPRSHLVADGNPVNGGLFGISRNVVSDIIWRYQIVSERYTAHDLRRTALTGMAKLGISPIVIANVANHRSVSKAGVTLGCYIQYDYSDEKRDALSRWATRLQTIVSSDRRK